MGSFTPFRLIGEKVHQRLLLLVGQPGESTLDMLSAADIFWDAVNDEISEHSFVDSD